MTHITLPRWYDLHAHFRQNDMIAPLIADHGAMGCAGILAMPNTKPPVAKIFDTDPGDGWSIESYRGMLLRAGADVFDTVIVPLYLTQHTTPAMIEAGAKSGVLKACKYYPPHGTTGAEFGAPIDTYMNNGVLRAMEDNGVILCVHGEEHGLAPAHYFDRHTNAEEIFYDGRMPRLVDAYPRLKIIGEHVTTKRAADFIKSAPAHVGATITPQHLIYTIGDLVKGLNFHLYCLPLVKFDDDRAALRAAVLDPANAKFFAGTDSAPHTTKATECGCAAGCYTGGIAPQLYAQAFELAGADLSNPAAQKTFESFLCRIGPNFYGLPVPSQTFTLAKKPQAVSPLIIGAQKILPLPLGMGQNAIPWSIQHG